MNKHIPFLRLLKTSSEIVKIEYAVATERKIKEILKKKGAVILLNFFSNDEIQALDKEYEKVLSLIDIPKDWEEVHNDVVDLFLIQEKFKKAQLDKHSIFPENLELDQAQATILSKIISSELLKNITTNYFQSLKYIFPARIQIVRTKKMTKEYDYIPYIPHVDRQRFLKFYCNLDDVVEKNGPLFIDSRASGMMIKWTQLWRAIQLLGGRKWNELDTTVNENCAEYLPIVSRKNDLVIFDSNLPHFAGKNVSSKARRVIIIEAQSQRGYKKYNVL